MKKFLVNIILILVFFVLQTSVFGRLSVALVTPNLIVILVAVCGFMQGDKTAIVVGFFCGLLLDIFTFKIWGFQALMYGLLGLAAGQFHNKFFPEDFKLPLLAITFSDLLCSVTMYFFTYLFRARFHFGFYFLNICLPELAYTLIVTFIIYPMFLFLYKFVFMDKAREA